MVPRRISSFKKHGALIPGQGRPKERRKYGTVLVIPKEFCREKGGHYYKSEGKTERGSVIIIGVPDHLWFGRRCWRPTQGE